MQAVTMTTECRQMSKSVTTASKATICSNNGGNVHTLKISINKARNQLPKQPASSMLSQLQLVYHLLIHKPELYLPWRKKVVVI